MSSLQLQEPIPDSGGLKPLDPSIRIVWTITLAVWSSLLILGVFIYELVHWVGNDDTFLPFGVGTLLVLLGGLTITIVIPRLRYRFWRYELRPEELYLERGIFNRVRTIVPLRRIQHLDVSQNILEREFDLAKLIVHTAGTRSSDVYLPGLRMEIAEQLHDEVKHFILEDTL